MPSLDSPDAMHIPASLDLLGRWVSSTTQFWRRLGNMESAVLSDKLAELHITQPVYVCGLARSGSTVLLEMLASHPDVTSHRYEDFPFLFTPYWWNTILRLTPFRQGDQRERAHGDGIMISGQSPEAMEEMLWRAFFDGQRALTAADRNISFDRFYQDHIKKLLLARKARRYVAKGNYNITRLPYLHSLFPDARFVIPVRDPVSHVESLMRQHARFCEAGRANPKILRHMSAAGHFEFGLGRRAIDVGDATRLRDIEQAWQRGEEVRGWALYWDMLHRYVKEQLQSNQALASCVMIVPFESLYSAAQDTITRMLEHTGLVNPDIVAQWTPKLRKPDYYESRLSAREIALIRDITASTAGLYSY